MRKWELIKQRKLLKIKSKILWNLYYEKYGYKLGEFNNTTVSVFWLTEAVSQIL